MTKRTSATTADAATTPRDEAEAVLRDLERRRERLVERGAALATERREVAFKAHAQRDGDARKILDRVNAEVATHDSELRSVDDAIAEAQDRLQQARQHEACEQDKANARAVAEVLEELAAHGAVVDDALHDLVEAGANLRIIFNRLHGLGCGHPTHEQLSTFGHLAIVTALGKSIWHRGFEVLAPGQRKTFSDVIGVWRAMLTKDVERRLGEPQQEHEAA